MSLFICLSVLLGYIINHMEASGSKYHRECFCVYLCIFLLGCTFRELFESVSRKYSVKCVLLDIVGRTENAHVVRGVVTHIGFVLDNV